MHLDRLLISWTVITTMWIAASAAAFPLDPQATFVGQEDQHAGSYVSLDGDLNGDGYDDLVIGATCGTHEPGEGWVHVFFGGAASWGMNADVATADVILAGEAAGDTAGTLTHAGDVNGDGYDDLIVGASHNDEAASNAGQVYLVLGRATGLANLTSLSQADASYLGEAQMDEAGMWVEGAGDVNDDGFDDVLITAPHADGGLSEGEVYLVHGRETGWAMDTSLAAADASFVGETVVSWVGFSLGGGGDVNGDGIDDFMVGVPHCDQHGEKAGQAYLLFGGGTWGMETSLGMADASFVGEGEDERAGEDTAIAGDLNGDGIDDILVGANLTDQEADDAGSVYLIFGSTTGWGLDTSLAEADAVWTGLAEQDYTGRAVQGAGDVNADGYDDVLIGVASSDANGSDSGQIHLWFGNPCGWLSPTSLSHSAAQFSGEAAGDYTGLRVTRGGDLNGDGRDDLGFGAVHNQQAAPDSGKAYVVLDLCKDHDGDGYDPCNGDCDDNDPDIHPDAQEDLQDGLDNDCDGIIDADEPCNDDDDDDSVPGDDDDDDDTGSAGDDDDDDVASEEPEGEDEVSEGSCECRSGGQAYPAGALLLTCLGVAVFVRLRRTLTSRTAA